MRSSTSSSKAQQTLLVYLVTGAVLLALVVGAWLVIPLSKRNQQNLFFAPLDNIVRIGEFPEGRILLLGGSSMGLSVSAEELSRSLGKPVINLGVHAGIGYRNLWNFYKPYIDKEKDLIVLSPEYEFVKKTSSISNEYCEVMFLSQNVETLKKMPLYCWPNLAVKTALNMLQLALNQAHPKDVYFRAGFNEHGDMVSHLGLKNRRINARDIIRFEPYSEKGVAQYKAFIQKEVLGAGYKVQFVPVTISQDFCNKNPKKILEMQRDLATLSNTGTLKIEIADLCYKPDYFFDTAYHMNKQGRKLKTVYFLKALKQAR